MKLITLLSLSGFVVLSYSGYGQSLSFVSPVSQYANSDVNQIMSGFLTVHNGSSSAKDVKVLRTVDNIAPGHSSYFCWDVCYAPSQSVSAGYLTIQPGADNNFFVSDVDPQGVAGMDTICYSFYDMNNITDHIDICLTYDITTGIPTIVSSQSNPLSVASPNPASTLSSINYYTDLTKNPKLVIYDLLGGKVFEMNLLQRQGVYIVNVSEFKQGIYLYSLLENGKAVATQKLVVSHK